MLITVSYLASCAMKRKTAEDGVVILKIDGSSTVYPLTSKIVEKFKENSEEFDIKLDVSGTGGGFQKFSERETMINNASREINDSEEQSCIDNGVNFRSFEIAYDGIAVVVNKSNDWADDLTVSELKNIWKEGGTEKWSDLREDWPDNLIERYGPGVSSGTYDYFKAKILTNGEAFVGDYKKSENDNLLVTGIANNPYSLGFFGLAYYVRNKEKLKLIAIDNGNGPVIPTKSTVGSGKYTPLSRPMYIYANQDFCLDEKGKYFLKFYLENAGKVADDIGYVPLTEAKYRQMTSSL